MLYTTNGFSLVPSAIAAKRTVYQAFSCSVVKIGTASPSDRVILSTWKRHIKNKYALFMDGYAWTYYLSMRSAGNLCPTVVLELTSPIFSGIYTTTLYFPQIACCFQVHLLHWYSIYLMGLTLYYPAHHSQILCMHRINKWNQMFFKFANPWLSTSSRQSLLWFFFFFVVLHTAISFIFVVSTAECTFC